MKKSRRRTELPKDYEQYLIRLTDEIFERACDEMSWTWNELADHANVSRSAVARLGNYITKLPRLQTFYKLASAVDMDLELVTKQVVKLRTAGSLKVG